MIADAYYFATGEGEKPREILLHEQIQAYGVQAIFSRPMYYHELRRCDIAYTVYSLKLKTFDTDNWAKWAEKHPDEVQILGNVEKLIVELEQNA